jgi:8-amino-7-oxononanoate synthase
MEGDLCRLPEILEACRRHGTRLMVDDAHGAGVLASGRGTCEHFGLADDVDLISLTFSKSFASLGGAVLGDEDVIHYLRHHSRSLIFSAGMAPASAAAAITALRILREEPWRPARVLEHGEFVRCRLAALGFDIGDSETPIIPVLADNTLHALFMWRRLMDAGVYTNPVLPPGASPRLRTSYLATHTRDELERVIEAFAAVADECISSQALAA